MEAIILAGGFGTRLKRTISDVPKPMAPIAGRPFLELLLTALAKKNFTRIILSLGFMSEKIISYFGNCHAGMKLVYEVEDKPLGTGGAIRQAIHRCESDHVFVFNGDTYLDLEVDEVEYLWQSTKDPIVVVREVIDTERYGKVEIIDGRIIAFVEKSESGPGLINAGCYILPKTAFDDFPVKQQFSIEKEFLAKQVHRTRINGFISSGYFIDIGVPEDYARAQIEIPGLLC